MANKFQLNNEEFVKRIIESIEKGVPAWRKGWQSESVEFDAPYNPTTSSYYQGINANRLLLEQWLNGYTDCRWATFNQIKEKGWHLQKSAKGVPVYKWTEYDKKTKGRPDWEKINQLEKEERKKYIKENVYWGMTNCGYVFNGNLIEGLARLEKKQMSSEERKNTRECTIDEIESLIANCNKDVSINYNGGNSAYYKPSTDSIHLPKKEMFDDKYSEYSTTLHEISHSTGHSKRLNRNLTNGFGTEEYAREELRAEIASMFLCMEFGKNFGQPQFENSSAYLKSWVSLLKDDYNEFNKAVVEALKITEFVKTNYMQQQKELSPALKSMQSGAKKYQSDKKTLSKTQAKVKQSGNAQG